MTMTMKRDERVRREQESHPHKEIVVCGVPVPGRYTQKPKTQTHYPLISHHRSYIQITKQNMMFLLDLHRHNLLASLLFSLPALIYGAGSSWGRHSYSLTTFDPSGNLDQVVRAIRASTLGVPIVALCLSADPNQQEDSKDSTIMTSECQHNIPSTGGIYITVPLRFLSTSPLIIDDGTPRIVPLSSSLCLAHTGVGADGRALSDIAIKLVLDHKYLYGEEMGVQDLLAGLSSKMQEMTMKGGSRPYGCALLVCCLDERGRNAMYRVDPSGAVVLMSSSREEVSNSDVGLRRSVTLMGNWENVKQKREMIEQHLEKQVIDNEEQIQQLLVDAARQTFVDTSHDENITKETPVLFASFTRQSGLSIQRITT